MEDIETIIYCSQEIRTKQGFHITAECAEKIIPEDLDALETIELVHKYNGKAIWEHPFTIDCPLIQYRLINYITDKKRIKLMKKLLQNVDGIEVSNSMNTLWMFVSNYFAKEFVNHNKTKTPAIAGGDEHKNLIGFTGNLIPVFDTSDLIGEEIQQIRWQYYNSGNFRRIEHLTDFATFSKYMILPSLKRILGLETKDFETDIILKVI